MCKNTIWIDFEITLFFATIHDQSATSLHYILQKTKSHKKQKKSKTSKKIKKTFFDKNKN